MKPTEKQSIPKYESYANRAEYEVYQSSNSRNLRKYTQNTKVPIVRKPIEMLNIPKYLQYVNNINTKYTKISIVRHPHQSISSKQYSELFRIKTYQFYVNQRNTKETKSSIVRQPLKYYMFQNIDSTRTHRNYKLFKISKVR